MMAASASAPASEQGHLPQKPRANRRLQKLLSIVILLIAISAVSLTNEAMNSDDIILQVLSQTDLMPAQTNKNGSNESSSSLSSAAAQRYVIVYEPYGYASMKDDSGENGFMRYLFRACFYEYRLPRAFLKVSRFKEELTSKESKELMFRAGVKKPPRGWKPFAKNRNVFLEEPYRDKRIDRLFKRSHGKIIMGLVAGILSMLGLVFLCGSLHYYEDYNHTNNGSSNSIKRAVMNIITRCNNHIRSRLPNTITSSPLWIALWRLFRTPAMLGSWLAVLVGAMATAACMPAVAVGTLLQDGAFCGRRCASSLESTADLEVDACIERCLPGNGAKLAVLASCLWFLVLVLVAGIAVVSVISARKPSVSSSLSKRWWWWNDVCLPLAIRTEQLCPRTLPRSMHTQ